MKSMPLQSNDTDYSKDIAFFGACCLFLSAIEYLIPKPLPFLRIGLANLPLMLALDILPLPGFFLLICIKVFGQALITGTLFSYVFLFSIAGTFCSALLMLALRRLFKKRISFIGIGTAGAMVSNASQLALAHFFIFGESVKYIAPVFMGAGLVTGVVLGVFANKVKLPRADRLRGDSQTQKHGERREEVAGNNEQVAGVVCKSSAKILFIVGLITMFVIALIPSTEIRVLIFLVLWLLAIIFKKKINPFFTILFLIVIIVFNLLVPHGKVLYSIGFFKITSGALTAGIHRAVTFQALVMLSKLTISDKIKLPGKFGNILGESLRIFSIMMNNKKKMFIDLFGWLTKNANNNS